MCPSVATREQHLPAARLRTWTKSGVLIQVSHRQSIRAAMIHDFWGKLLFCGYLKFITIPYYVSFIGRRRN
jgi:hypothetical protein